MSTQRTLLGVLIGLTAGAAIGILLAPRSGKETRAILKKKGKKAKDDISDLLDKGYDKWKEARNKIVERANMTREDVKDFLSFMSAEGADLKDRIASDVKSTAKGVASTGKRAVDQVTNN
ncbi:MAG: YtxH domain-containing protein [Flavobacteriales bacterium]|jgi:gas vesicle protein|nr:YtxH domain-containing protein [Flavobacteriales bacterium]MCB0758908.1 YtxH domain-containing protein [Flavobacteriales bacterium]